MKDIHHGPLHHFFLATKCKYDFQDKASKQTKGLTFEKKPNTYLFPPGGWVGEVEGTTTEEAQ